MSNVPPDITRRIEDAAAALIDAGTPNPTNDQVRTHLSGGSLSHISPVMRAFRARLREQRTEQVLPADLQQLLTGQLGLLGEVHELRTEALPLCEQIARLTTTGEHLSVQLKETKAN